MKTNHWIRLILLFIVTIGAIWYFTGVRRYRAALSREAEQATAVTLERFGFADEVLQSVEISGPSFKWWLNSLQVKPETLVNSHSDCWVPHHRIRIHTPGGQRVVEISFTCNEFTDSSLGRRKIPDHWGESFRELFRAAGISDTGPDRAPRQTGNIMPESEGTKHMAIAE